MNHVQSADCEQNDPLSEQKNANCKVEQKSNVLTIEMPWTTEEERHLNAIAEECSIGEKVHSKAANNCRKKFKCVGIPAVVLPLAAASLYQIATDVDQSNTRSWNVVNQVALTLTGVLNALNQVYNYGEKSKLHDNSALMYGNLNRYIQNELVKPRQFRLQLDVFLERVNSQWNNIASQAPPL